MDLEEFIRNTLVSLHDGVQSANKAIMGKQIGEGKTLTYAIEGIMGTDSKANPVIEFDVAVVASEGSESEGGAKLRIPFISAGGGGSSSAGSEATSRVRFRIVSISAIN